MAWIESHQKLEKSGKLLRLAELLNINRYQAIGHLHAFWWWALDNAEDGDVTRFSSVTVARVCGWSDYLRDENDLSQINESTNKDLPEKAFFAACIEAGLLDKVRGRVTIHNWNEYTHRYFAIVEKTRRNREQIKARVKQFRERNVDARRIGNANVTHHGNGAVTPSNAPTRPNLTRPDLTRKKKSIARTFDFAKVYDLYPNKDSRKDAERHFKASVKTDQDFADIQKAVANYLRHLQVETWKQPKSAKTWFNDWRSWVAYAGSSVKAPILPPKPRPPDPREDELPSPEFIQESKRVAGLVPTGVPK